MRSLIRFGSALLLSISLSPSLALSQTEGVPAEIPQDTPMLNMGNWEVGGEGYYFKSNTGNDRQLTLSPTLQYFFLNRFSAGAKLMYEDSTLRSTALSIGPTLTWYFALINKAAFYVDQTVLYVNPEGSVENYFNGESGVGVDYFLSPSVAFGPSLRGVYFFSGDTLKPEGGLAVRVALSVYL